MGPGGPAELIKIDGRKLEGSPAIKNRHLKYLDDEGGPYWATHRKLQSIFDEMREKTPWEFSFIHHYHIREETDDNDLLKLETLAFQNHRRPEREYRNLQKAKKLILDKLEDDGFQLSWPRTLWSQSKRGAVNQIKRWRREDTDLLICDLWLGMVEQGIPREAAKKKLKDEEGWNVTRIKEALAYCRKIGYLKEPNGNAA